jgi:hypothetical protein
MIQLPNKTLAHPISFVAVSQEPYANSLNSIANGTETNKKCDFSFFGTYSSYSVPFGCREIPMPFLVMWFAIYV